MNFLTNITIGQYAPGSSFIHLLDPRYKIVILIILITQCFLIDKWFLLIAALLFFVVISFFTGISWTYIMKGLKAIIPFVAITFIFNSVLTPGRPIISYVYPDGLIFGFNPSDNVSSGQLFSLNVTAEGLEFGFFMSLRLIIIVFATSIFTLTTSPMEITDAIESLLQWGKPLRIPAHEIAMMMSIALRFIPTLIEHLDKIVRAQMSRGADFESKSIVTRAKCFIPVLIPLFVNAFKTADDLAIAMESRCYKGGEGRTKLKDMKSGWKDVFALSFTLVFSAVLIFLQFYDRVSK